MSRQLFTKNISKQKTFICHSGASSWGKRMDACCIHLYADNGTI